MLDFCSKITKNNRRLGGTSLQHCHPVAPGANRAPRICSPGSLAVTICGTAPPNTITDLVQTILDGWKCCINSLGVGDHTGILEKRRRSQLTKKSSLDIFGDFGDYKTKMFFQINFTVLHCSLLDATKNPSVWIWIPCHFISQFFREFARSFLS